MLQLTVYQKTYELCNMTPPVLVLVQPRETDCQFASIHIEGCSVQAFRRTGSGS